MGKEEKPLTVRQERFAQHYAAGSNGTQAYLEAGYPVSATVAGVQAHKMLKVTKVAARIAALRAKAEGKMEKKTLLSIEEKRAFLADLLRATPRDLGPDSPLCQEYSEDRIAGGTRGKLKRGKKPSGNESEEMPVIRRKMKMGDKLRVIELDSKLAGHFEPEQLVVETGPVTLDTLREIAARVRLVSPLIMARTANAGKGARKG